MYAHSDISWAPLVVVWSPESGRRDAAKLISPKRSAAKREVLSGVDPKERDYVFSLAILVCIGLMRRLRRWSRRRDR